MSAEVDGDRVKMRHAFPLEADATQVSPVHSVPRINATQIYQTWLLHQAALSLERKENALTGAGDVAQ